ncbi:MAG: YfbM family protein [Lachnospiraceae bacterium]|nr:YfbM family protein [Lachnospiraceae bacterium]
MGIRGYYRVIEDSVLSQVISGDKEIFDIAPLQYQELDIDKFWRAIHYLLCNDIENGEPPGGYVVPVRDDNEIVPGIPVSDITLYYITAQQVKEASDFLNALDDDTLKSMYDFKAMRENKVYPLFGDEPDTDAECFYEDIYSFLMMIRDYFVQAVENGYGIIFWLI